MPIEKVIKDVPFRSGIGKIANVLLYIIKSRTKGILTNNKNKLCAKQKFNIRHIDTEKNLDVFR